MIASFARMHRDATPRVFDEPPHDAPPEAYVQKVTDEGGDVFLSPLLEALREALLARRRPAGDASKDEPQRKPRAARTEGP